MFNTQKENFVLSKIFNRNLKEKKKTKYRVNLQMRPPLKKAMFHLAWSPDSLPTSEAIAPLLEYLDMHLVVLNSALLIVNFNRVLQDIWEVVLAELSNQMDGNAGVSRIFTPLIYFCHYKKKIVDNLVCQKLQSTSY